MRKIAINAKTGKPTALVGGLHPASRIPKKVKSSNVPTGGARITPRPEQLKTWFCSVDWSEWWSEWYLSVDEKNRFFYKQIKNFIDTKSQSAEQRDFLHWYLGAESSAEEDPRYAKYAYIAPAPVGWTKKRSEGGWFHDVSLRAFGSEIVRRTNALDALREAGNKIGLHFMIRAGKMAQLVDEFFHGNPFASGKELNENMKRFQMYMEAQKSVQQYYAKAQELYAKSHGVNFDDMSGLVKILEATTVASANALTDGKALTPTQTACMSFVEVLMAKAGRYPAVAALLPGDVVDAVSERLEESVEKPAPGAKGKVQ